MNIERDLKIAADFAEEFATFKPPGIDSVQYVKERLFTVFGGKINIRWCEMIADAFGQHKLAKVCKLCGSNEIIWEATAVWNERKQCMDFRMIEENVKCWSCGLKTQAVLKAII